MSCEREPKQGVFFPDIYGVYIPLVTKAGSLLTDQEGDLTNPDDKGYKYDPKVHAALAELPVSPYLLEHLGIIDDETRREHLGLGGPLISELDPNKPIFMSRLRYIGNTSKLEF